MIKTLLKDVCRVINGFAFDSKKFTFNSKDKPLIRIRDVKRGYTETFYSGEYDESYVVKKGDYLIGMDGDFNLGIWNSDDALLNQRVCKLDPNQDVLLGKFLYYLLPPYLDEINAKTTFATVKHLSSKQVLNLEIPVPSLSEQTRIVEKLDAAFEKIDRLKENAEKGLQAVKNLWEAILRDELKPKEGWKATTMDGVCSITSSLVDPRLPEYKNKLHVGGSNIESYTGKLSNLLTAEQEDLVSNKFYFDQTMVLYNKIRPYLVKIAMPDFDGICSADMYPLKPKNGVITREYLYYVLNSKDFTDYAIMGSARAGMPKVNRDCLFAYSFSIPSIDEQKIIVSKLFQTSSICNKLQQKLELEIAEYEALKQSVLRKAFRGEL